MTAGISAPVVASNKAGTQPATGVMAAPGLCGPAPAAIVGAIWITPVSVCHHVSACVLNASMASQGYFSRGRPARRLRSKLRGRPRTSRGTRAARWVGTRAVPSVGARRGPARRGVQPTGRGSVGRRGTRPRRGLRKKKRTKKQTGRRETHDGAAVVAHDLAVPPPRLRSRGLALARRVDGVGQGLASRDARTSKEQRGRRQKASGLMGSPTEPSSLSDARDVAVTGSSPERMSARIAVGAV